MLYAPTVIVIFLAVFCALFRFKRCRLLTVLCADKLAGAVACYTRLLGEVAGGCLPFADFMTGAVVVYACRFLRQCLPFILAYIPFYLSFPLFGFIARHLLLVVAHFFVCYFVEVFLGVMLLHALKIRIKRMSAIYAADSRNASKLPHAERSIVRIFPTAAENLPLPFLMFGARSDVCRCFYKVAV